MDPEQTKASSLYMDVHTVLSFISCLGKHHDSHDLLNERLGTHSATHQTVAS
jgi:hypothetical protein